MLNLKKIFLIEENFKKSREITPSFSLNFNKKQNSYFIKLILKDTLPSNTTAIDFVFTLPDFNYKTMFCHGFQSWTYSREFSLDEKIKPLRFLKTLLLPYGEGHFYQPRGGLYSFNYTYFRKEDEVFFIGSLLEKQAFTAFAYKKESNEIIITVDIDGLSLNSGKAILEIFCEKGELLSIFQKYAKLLRIPIRKIPFAHGYTSWYNLYNKIDEAYLLQLLNEFYLRKIPLNYFQIDDGWQNKVGDWLYANKKFPSGMAFLSEKIHQAGYKAGLWLAPFISEKDAEIIKKNPHWLLRDPKNKLVKAGFNPLWSYTFYALNWQNKEVQDYLRDVFKRIFHEWKFDMVKLDFLYASCLIPQDGKSRARLMEEALLFLRKLMPKKVILGCGVPLISAAGKVDYCRIGSDVALKWEDAFLKFCHFRERVSVINSLTSTISRNHQNQIFYGNDPDVFILRSIKKSFSNKKIDLTFNERYTLYLLNLIFGQLVFTSDNPKEYKPHEWQIYCLQYPWPDIQIKRQSFEKDFLKAEIQTKKGNYLLLANLSSQKQRVLLGEGYYFCREKDAFFPPRSEIELLPHQSYIFYNFTPSPYAFAGSLSHLLSGSEFTQVKLSPKGLKISYEKQAILREALYFVKGPYEIKPSPHWEVSIREEKELILYKFVPLKYF